MKCFVGIDLGSTTTKSVILDEQQRIVGRGITNSRSNYEVACAIARSEAFANVRLSLCERAIPDGFFDGARRVTFVSALERSFRLAWHRARLDALGKVMMREVPVVEKLAGYVRDYEADGLLINSVKSCDSFSAGQLAILRAVEEKTGKPGGFIESDLVDPRYFGAANIKNRIESYLQMLEQRRAGAVHA